MSELSAVYDAAGLIVLFVAVGGVLFFLALVIGNYWRDIRLAELEANLKQDMLDRGMTADEIKTIIEAKPPKK
jgi:hypothetical protein